MKLTALLISMMMWATIAVAQDKQERDGKNLFTIFKCNSCHSVESMGLAKKPNQKVPDLSAIGEKFDAEFLAKFMKKKEQVAGKKHPAPFRGSDEEAADLARWLAGLKPTDASK
jgi:cytochrome c553